jgi:HK97 family phage major capsid protein
VIDVLRPYSPLLKAGVTVYEGLESNAVFPRLTGDVTGYWLSTESTTITEQDPLFGGAAVDPKTWGAVCRWSRQLQLQAPNMEDFLREVFARAAIQAVDTAALVGPDTVGQPLGLLNSQGIGTQSGTSYSHANSWTTRGTLAAANVNDESIGWIGATGVRTILATRERGAGDEYIWSELDQITGRAANVTTIMPSATLVAGDWSQLCYAFFGSGFVLDSTQFNSASDFATGISAMRLMVSVDTFLQRPSAFVSVTGIT